MPPSLSATQFQIKNNLEEYRSFVQDLASWQKEMKEKEKAVSKATHPSTSRNVPPIRGTRSVDVDSKPDPDFLPKQPAETSAPAKRNGSERIKSADYRAWDKFDVEKAIEEIDTESAFGKEGAREIKEQYNVAEQKKKASSEEERLEKALLEKEQGNAYFKRANYAKAISHYGKSMALDPRNPVLPINRAMAYLKLEKWAEAEEDCTRGLSLDPKNVKALWRRGIARKEQGKIEMARKDLEKALVFDPSNKAVKEELDKLLQITAKATSVPPLGPQSWRIPIEEVETDEEAKDTKEEEDRRKQARENISAPRKAEVISPMVEMTPVKTTLTPSANVAPTSSTRAALDKGTAKPVAASEKTVSVPPTESKSKKESSKSSSVHAVKDNGALSTRATEGTSSTDISKTTESSSTVTPSRTNVYTPPTTSFEFDRDWKTFKRDDSMLFEYLQCIPPSSFPSIFKSSLESDYLAKMIDIMNRFYIESKSPDEIYAVLQNLCAVKRFDMTLMFLSRAERKGLESLFAHFSSCIAAGTFSVSESDLAALAKQYKVAGW